MSVAEKIALDSLAKLLIKREIVSRSDEPKAGAAESKGRFDGLLQSYLGCKDRTAFGSNSKKSMLLFDPFRGNPESSKSAGKFEKSKNAIRDKAERTDEEADRLGDDDPYALGFASYFALLTEEGPVDEAMAEAAEAAARIILGLLNAGMAADGGATPLATLSGMFAGFSGGSLSALGVSTLDGASMADALESANVSAEMNNDAVLATLEDLLSGMPKNALQEALKKVSEGKGLEQNAETMLSVLNGQVSNSGYAAAASNLFASLGVQDHVSGCLATEPAKPSGEAESNDLFEKFLKENSGKTDVAALGASVDVKETLQGFRNWLETNGMSGQAKALDAGLAAIATGGGDSGSGAGGGLGDGAAKKFLENLESALRENASEFSRALADALPGTTADKSIANASGAAADTGKAPEDQRSAAIFDQIGNIERIAEIMRHNNRQGVQHLTMQLSPPELGKVMIRVENRNGKLSALFRVGEAESAVQIQDGLRQLKDNLRAHGVELGEVEVREDPTLSGDAGGGRADRDHADGARTGGGLAGDADQEVSVADSPVETLGIDENGRVNLFA
jgi:flagellar hook-length control protein FliK